MTKNKKALLYTVYLILVVTMVLLFLITTISDNYIIFCILISIFTTTFHFTIRFSLASVICKMIRKSFKYDNFWFKEKLFEKKIYKLIKIKSWKGKLPTWNDADFNISVNDKDQLLTHMCYAEAYHEVCMLLSFIPVLFTCWWGEFWVFFLTSVGGALFDFLFVLIQRYNRPRVLKHFERKIS